MRLSPFLMLADCVNGALLCWVFAHQVPFNTAAAWAASVVMTALATVGIWWWAYRRGPPLQAGRWQVVLLALLSAMMAGLFGLAAARLIVDADAGGREIIIAATAGLISAGAFARATVAPAALAWVAALNIGAIAGLSLKLSATSEIILTFLGIYDLIILLSILSFSAMYIARLRAEAAAARQEQVIGLLLHDFEDHSSNWLWESDRLGRLTRVSSRMGEVLGCPPGQLLNVPMARLLLGEQGIIPPGQRNAITHLERRFAGAEPFRDHVVPAAIGGEVRWWSLSAKPIADSTGAPVGWRGVGADITETRRYEERLAQLASRDSLTGLLNRHAFQRLLGSVMAVSNRPCALMLLDLDNFKSVNDTLGHSVGDELLQLLARRFHSDLSGVLSLARLGGDEFALLADEMPSAEAAQELAGSLLALLRDPCLLGEARIEIKGSVGIALAPDHGRNADQLFRNADVALYAAKEAGGDRAHLFDKTLGDYVQHRSAMVRDLGLALREGQFTLLYQPQVDSMSGRVTSFEALLRWHHPEHGVISPNDFIPLAEETGQIVSIGAWVLDRACRDALEWSGDIKVAVNLSAVQLNSRSIVDTVRACLAHNGFPPHRLELEVTETALIHDDAIARAALHSFREMGIEVALDDFGVGYSMLSYLQSFPFDKLKIDHSFVATLTESDDAAHRAIFRAIIDLAEAMALRTVAEGIDSEAKLRAVCEHSCNAVQGYFIARPMPATSVALFLADWKSW